MKKVVWTLHIFRKSKKLAKLQIYGLILLFPLSSQFKQCLEGVFRAMTIVRLIIPCILVTIAASVDSQSLEEEIIKRQGFKPWNNAFLR